MRNRGVVIPRLYVDPLISTKGRYVGSGRKECARNELPSRHGEPGFVAKEQSGFSACLVPSRDTEGMVAAGVNSARPSSLVAHSGAYLFPAWDGTNEVVP